MRRMPAWFLIPGLVFSTGLARAETVSGTQVAERTGKALSAIHWAKDLDSAMEEARKEKKLVFWLQIVGDLERGL